MERIEDDRDRKEFVDILINGVRAEILNMRVPDDWDGTHLRYLIRDQFDEIVWSGYRDKRSSEYRKYINDRRVNCF